MKLTDTLSTCLISLYYHLFDVNVFFGLLLVRAPVVSLGRKGDSLP